MNESSGPSATAHPWQDKATAIAATLTPRLGDAVGILDAAGRERLCNALEYALTFAAELDGYKLARTLEATVYGFVGNDAAVDVLRRAAYASDWEHALEIVRAGQDSQPERPAVSDGLYFVGREIRFKTDDPGCPTGGIDVGRVLDVRDGQAWTVELKDGRGRRLVSFADLLGLA